MSLGKRERIMDQKRLNRPVSHLALYEKDSTFEDTLRPSASIPLMATVFAKPLLSSSEALITRLLRLSDREMTFFYESTSTSTAKYSRFNEQVFRSSVDKALKTVEKILAVGRNPQLAEEVDHEYPNKFELADRMTNIAIVAQMECFELLGLELNNATAIVADRLQSKEATTLRFQASEKCAFLKRHIVEVPMDVSHETTQESQTTTGSSNFFGTTKKTVQRLVKKVKEFHWKVDIEWEVSLFSGTNVEEKTVVRRRSSSMIVITQSKDPPIDYSKEHQPLDLSLTWFLEQIDIANSTAQFHVKKETAKTPRRNDQVENALAFFKNLRDWAAEVRFHFIVQLQQDIVEKNNPVVVDPTNTATLIKSCSAMGVFIPILPLLEDRGNSSTSTSTAETEMAGAANASTRLALPPDTSESPGLTGDDCVQLLNHHKLSLTEKIASLQKAFPSAHLTKVFSMAEATLVVVCEHIGYLCKQYEEVVQYLEKMLEDQLVKAIGKRVTTEDLEQFVRYHNARYLNPPPRAFCHAIGRPNHYPFGILSIESENGDADGSRNMRPIETMAKEIDGLTSLKLPLTAATTVELTGRTFLHGWMNHRSQHAGHKGYQVVARARQFSSFLLVIGTMTSADRLDPKDAIIVKNKDEVLIPLLLNELPSAKEFKDAIQSLSPEQRRFAQSFRTMQLESSVFGVSVIQIKPQLEVLLGLPEDSLAKEIKLTQDLMELFIEYQVPSDLLSYDGHNSTTSVSSKAKVDNVKKHVEDVFQVIKLTMEKQLEEATMKADMAVESASIWNPQRPPGLRKSMVDSEEVTRGSGSFQFGGQPALSPFGFSSANNRASNFGAMGFGAAASQEQAMGGGLFGAAASPAPLSMGFGAATHHPAQPVETTAVPPVRPAPAQSLDSESLQVDSVQVTIDQNQRLAPNSAQKSDTSTIDFTTMPKALDESIEKYDADSALRSTIIKTSESWSRRRQENLLTKTVKAGLGQSELETEKNQAFDLLDALSRSGSLPISFSDLHVIICMTHCFEKDVMGTVVEDNINPIERLEVSTLLLGSIIHGKQPLEMIATAGDLHRIKLNSPALLSEW
eukprot:scaffold22663_cov111-Cylindrotheca_fusiformis.AAC.2